MSRESIAVCAVAGAFCSILVVARRVGDCCYSRSVESPDRKGKRFEGFDLHSDFP